MFAPTVSTTQNRRLGQTARADMESAPAVRGAMLASTHGYRADGRLWEGRGPGMPGPYIVPCSYSTPLSLSYSTVQPSACKRAAVGVSAAVRT